MSEITPLLTGRVRPRVGFYCSLPFFAKFIACIMLGILPLMSSCIFDFLDLKLSSGPGSSPPSFFQQVYCIFRSAFPFACDYFQDKLWRDLEPALENLSYLCLMEGEQATWSAVRKTPSLNTVFKGPVLKGLPTAVVIGQTLNILLPWWLVPPIVTAILCLMGLMSYCVFVPLARTTQEIKRERDNLVDAREPDHDIQVQYTACLKVSANVRNYWKTLLFLGVFALHPVVTAEGDNVLWVRLLEKVLSMEETCNKMASSFSTAMTIIRAPGTWENFFRNIDKAIEATSGVQPLALDMVEEFQPLMKSLERHLHRSNGDTGLPKYSLERSTLGQTLEKLDFEALGTKC
ncbi:hypothetical protein FOFC_20666 [Fusarium oxysporum]|nr:hypothetical protein FOFC_20666 [Fusarium oxysporum]